ncbi:hypothetical protein [Humibacter ginsenosidimutans]|uniref:Uncharacterized protein n=1 Tax=Humibacter ginsenosidimutans TaxID=2599293 RepID=A0A5B8M0X2_9MICO|nr:hypothetical protein [Humibacter ginsenosidimutans]QDZ13589.1 hypothetical protein FPZ11_01140 [Humibacter ginsenosidimutans]
MTSRKATDLRERTCERDDDLRDVLRFLLKRANMRQMWLIFLDDENRIGDPLMPMDGYPDDPEELVTTDDLGELTHGRLLMHRAGMLRELTGNAAIVLVWERTGRDAVDEETRHWAGAMAEAAHDLGVPLRAQFLLHDSGIRQLQVDDYVR